jgi:predicted house-cleaning noncanonical NTP pyrophosphatase (MazG superfamily)
VGILAAMPAGVEELVDMLEVGYTLASLLDVSLGQLEALRIAKKLKRDGFDQNLDLLEVKKGE